MPSRLQKIRNWPERARQARWSAAALAKQCGVTVRTLHRFFLNRTGQSTRDWLAAQRQRHARRLLRDLLSVKEAATQLGYQHQTNFTRRYKRHTGVCPSRHLPQLSAKD